MIPLRDSTPSRTRPLVMLTLIGLNTAVFVFELSLPREQLTELLFLFGLVPGRPAEPAWAAIGGVPLYTGVTFVTSTFLHGGFLHLIGNMWSLWIFGDNVEDRMGHGRFLVFYLLCGAGAGLAQYLAMPDSAVPTIGASGAIAGVMGAYFVMFPRARILMLFPVFLYPMFFVMPAFLYLGYWFLFQLLTGTAALAGSGQVGGVAWWAHAGGFVAGVLLHRPLRRPRERRART
jgi:membrane associated rhomboid family serine protease